MNMKRRDFVKAASASIFSLPFVACSTEEKIPTPVVQLDSGKIRGSVLDGVYRYLGTVSYTHLTLPTKRIV